MKTPTLRYAVIVAGGSGTRMGGALAKQFLPLADGTPILVQTVRVFLALQNCQVIVVLPASDRAFWHNLAEKYHISDHKIVPGGATRTQSVAAGMALVPSQALVAIHDGVRPFVTAALIEACFTAAKEYGATCAAVPSKDSLRHLLPDGSSQAVAREEYFLVQTPQTFLAKVWQDAYALVGKEGTYTDDASLVEAAGHAIHLVPGSYANRKITTPEDLPT